MRNNPWQQLLKRKAVLLLLQSSTGDKIEQLYMGNVIKYLIVPEDADVPAGLDKDVILIRKPVEKTYVELCECSGGHG